MTTVPPPGPDAAMERRVVAVLVGLVAEVALLAALAHAAWSPSDSDTMPPLATDEGVTTIAILGLPASVVILGACLWIALAKPRWRAVGASMMLCLAGAAGFVGYALTSFSRVEMSDC